MPSISELARSLLTKEDLVNWVPVHESQDCFTYYDRCPSCGSATVAVPDAVTPGGIRACIFCLSRNYVITEVQESGSYECRNCDERKILTDKLAVVESRVRSTLEERDAFRQIVIENEADADAILNENIRLRFELERATELLRKKEALGHSEK